MGPPLTPPAAGRTRADAWLEAVLLVALALVMARAHLSNVDAPARAKKAALHAAVLDGRAPDPYQYKLWTTAQAVEGLSRATGADVFDLYAANLVVSLVALLFAHRAWLSALLGPRPALLGSFLLAALAHGLFLDYYHHPYDLWGVAGFCLLLRGLARGAGPGPMAALALATGLVWEKHALLPFVHGHERRRAGVPLPRAVAETALLLAASLAVPVGLRVGLGTDRPAVDVTPLAEQDWGRVALHQGPYVLPFALVLAVAGARVPRLVRLLWLHVPALLGAYAVSRFLLYEQRSFWAFAPVFTATAAAWASPATERPPRAP